ARAAGRSVRAVRCGGGVERGPVSFSPLRDQRSLLCHAAGSRCACSTVSTTTVDPSTANWVHDIERGPGPVRLAPILFESLRSERQMALRDRQLPGLVSDPVPQGL